MTIKQTVTFKTTPKRLYEVLTSAREFSEVTGAPADIGKDEGGAFTCFGGNITGRQVELLPNTRIVQAWRVASWDEGVYSIVRFDFYQSGELTTLVFEHTGYPNDAEDHLEGGWHKMYWDPLRAYLE